jgi:hypothetical protein
MVSVLVYEDFEIFESTRPGEDSYYYLFQEGYFIEYGIGDEMACICLDKGIPNGELAKCDFYNEYLALRLGR